MGHHWSVFIFWDSSPVFCDSHISNRSCQARIVRKDYEVSKAQPRYIDFFFARVLFFKSPQTFLARRNREQRKNTQSKFHT